MKTSFIATLVEDGYKKRGGYFRMFVFVVNIHRYSYKDWENSFLTFIRFLFFKSPLW